MYLPPETRAHSSPKVPLTTHLYRCVIGSLNGYCAENFHLLVPHRSKLLSPSVLERMNLPSNDLFLSHREHHTPLSKCSPCRSRSSSLPYRYVHCYHVTTIERTVAALDQSACQGSIRLESLRSNRISGEASERSRGSSCLRTPSIEFTNVAPYPFEYSSIVTVFVSR